MVNEDNARLVVTGRVTQCLIEGFTVISRERGDEPAVGYIAESLVAVDICRACNAHDDLLEAANVAESFLRHLTEEALGAAGAGALAVIRSAITKATREKV